MRNLRLEELEPRQMLNGTGFCAQAPQAQPAAGDGCAAPVGDHSSFINLGNRAGEGGAAAGQPGRVASPSSEGPAPEALSPASPTPPSAALPRPVTPAAAVNPAGADLPAAAAEVVQAPPGGQPPPSPGLVGLAAALSFGALTQGLVAVQFPTIAVSGAEAISPLEDWWSPRPPFTSPGGAETPAPTAPAGEPGGERSEPPPRIDLLAGLPPIDLAALDAGLRQFLDQLRCVLPRPPWQRNETGLSLWAVAAAAAATACAIALRQLRRSEAESPRETINL
jgi:hypothetical protein